MQGTCSFYMMASMRKFQIFCFLRMKRPFNVSPSPSQKALKSLSEALATPVSEVGRPSGAAVDLSTKDVQQHPLQTSHDVWKCWCRLEAASVQVCVSKRGHKFLTSNESIFPPSLPSSLWFILTSTLSWQQLADFGPNKGAWGTSRPKM